MKRLNIIWMDGGYRGDNFVHWVMDLFFWIVEIVVRPLQRKGFVLLPRRSHHIKTIITISRYFKEETTKTERLKRGQTGRTSQQVKTNQNPLGYESARFS